jgi:hypothetical protein
MVDKDYMRSLPVLGFFLIIGTAACSNSAPLPTANPAGRHQTGGSSLTPMDQTGSINAAGPVVGMIGGGFTINAGSGKGNIHVYVNSSTTVTGTIAVGGTASVVGTGSFMTSITATSVIVTSGSIPSSSAVSVSGPVTNFIPGGFTLNGGPSVGNIHIFTGSSTPIGGGPVKVGSYVQATGSGSLASSITAIYVAVFQTAPPMTPIAGSVAAATAYGFNVAVDSSHPAVPVVLNKGTVIGGGTLAPGAKVTLSGTGSEAVSILASRILVATPSPSPGASPTPTPGPISMTHVQTMDYLGGVNGTRAITWAAAAPYLTWAETSAADSVAIHGAGIKTMFYIDANRTEAGDALNTTDETTYAHDCNNARVTDMYNGSVTQYVMNPASPSMQALFAADVASVAALGTFDAIFEDDAGALSAYSTYAPFSAMPCNYSDAAWIAGGLALDAAPPIPVLFNGLSGLAGHGISMSTALLSGANVLGGDYEGCYSAGNQLKMGGWLWSTIEDSELYTVSQGKAFECLQIDENTASTQTDARLYAYASFLLSYDPSRDVLWELGGTPSGFHVFPESSLVALQPKTPEPTDVSSLLLTGGAYGREYGACYIRGAFVGPCAVAVNPSSAPVAFPFVQYQHSVVLSGADVLEGGTISTSGTVPTTLGATEAAIVFP